MAATKPRPTAPDGLDVPEWVAAHLCQGGATRADLVLRHGFSEAQIKSPWWQSRLRQAGLSDGLSPAITFPSLRDGTPVLTRGDLFGMARGLRGAEGGGTDEQWLSFLWHVLAWGSGTARRNNGARIDAFADPDLRGERVGYLREAADHVWNGDVRKAYSTLILPGRGRIPRLGPAFFTKVLYFLGEGIPQEAQEIGCLILDARVAGALRPGWGSLPVGNYNWYTDTYVSYCELLVRWAVDVSDRAQRVVAADEVERVLFEGA